MAVALAGIGAAVGGGPVVVGVAGVARFKADNKTAKHSQRQPCLWDLVWGAAVCEHLFREIAFVCLF